MDFYSEVWFVSAKRKSIDTSKSIWVVDLNSPWTDISASNSDGGVKCDFDITSSGVLTATAVGGGSFSTSIGGYRNAGSETLETLTTIGYRYQSLGTNYRAGHHYLFTFFNSTRELNNPGANIIIPNIPIGSVKETAVGALGTNGITNRNITHLATLKNSVSGNSYYANCIRIVLKNSKILHILVNYYHDISYNGFTIFGVGDNPIGIVPLGQTTLDSCIYRKDLKYNLADFLNSNNLYNALNSLQLPSHMDNKSTASTIKSNADTLWKWISNAYGSSWSYYSQAKSKYDEIVAAYSWIPIRDQAYNSLITITTPTNTSDTSTTNTAKDNADTYWSTLNSKDISEWSNYNTSKAKYDAIVAIHTNNTERDSAYNSLTGLVTPVTSTVQATAKTTKDNATAHWNTINAKTTSEWSNYNTAEAKYNDIVAGYNNTITRDTRLTKKSDKTELNTSNNKLTFNQTVVHNKGMSDYSSIKSTLSSVNNKLK